MDDSGLDRRVNVLERRAGCVGFLEQGGMSFDRLACHYDWMERVLAGPILQRCRTAFLAEAAKAETVLLAGEGHGRFLLELCRINPHARISYVDASAEMARVAKARLIRGGEDPARVTFSVMPFTFFESGERYQLIATQFFLDCFGSKELEIVVTKLSNSLAENGSWIVADFSIPDRGWRRWRARAVLALAYSFFRVAARLSARRLAPPAPLLEKRGLRLERRERFNFDLLYAELWRGSKFCEKSLIRS